MNTLAAVQLWGRRIGAVSWSDERGYASFEYDPAFAQSDIQVAPLTMPLGREIFRFPNLSREAFHGLPGLLADSLPDRFGNALIDTWLATQGRSPEDFNAVERLCYAGDRGMGALEFEPARGPRPTRSEAIRVDALVELAGEILQQRGDLHLTFESQDRKKTLTEILQVGTSAGGARAKAVIAWNSETNEVRSGQVSAPDGFEHWLLKFDGVRGNRDKELDDPAGYGAIEFAYSRMATAAGLTMNECRLFEENDRRHFMTKRFDRTESGRKLHMQSLGALAHFDFNRAGEYSYEQAMLAMRRLDLSTAEVEEQFRRMVFNIVARNQDDHVKNIAFLMDRAGRWSLAPAFDVTYSYNPAGLWTAQHQMSVNGKRRDFELDDLRACARTVSLKRGSAESILEEVHAAVSQWPDFAAAALVDEPHREGVQRALRLHLASSRHSPSSSAAR